MKLINKSKNKEVSDELVFYNTIFQKFRGLMFKRDFTGVALFSFNKEMRMGTSIHTFFVFFPIDIFWLNKNKKVVDVASVNPFTINVVPNTPAQYFLEALSGKINNIELGDILDW